MNEEYAICITPTCRNVQSVYSTYCTICFRITDNELPNLSTRLKRLIDFEANKKAYVPSVKREN